MCHISSKGPKELLAQTYRKELGRITDLIIKISNKLVAQELHHRQFIVIQQVISKMYLLKYITMALIKFSRKP